MDKSESESLEEWDLVSSVYDSEQEKKQDEKKADPQIEHSETSSNGIGDSSSSINVTDSIDTSEKASDNKKTNESDANIKTSESVEESVDTESQKTADSDIKAKIEIHSEKETMDEVEEAATEGDTEEMSEPDTEEITVIETIMYDVKNISDVDSGKNIATNTEKISSGFVKKSSCENSQGTSDIVSKASDDSEMKESSGNTNEGRKSSSSEHKTDGDDYVVESSAEQFESSTLPEIYPVLTEQENASIESSSSDIDIIDENLDDSVTSSFLHPLTLSISSSVDTSSVLNSTDDERNTSRVEEVQQPEIPESYSIKSEILPRASYVHAEKTIPKQSEYDYQQSQKMENVHQPSKQQQQRGTQSNISGSIFHFLRNMKCLEWSLLGGVIIGLYLTVVFNQTNIFAVVEKEEVVSQMKMMIDELKHDNKLLKDQMLSEMKNEKVFSSVEHQIKELRKENSRLNHMLYDVAKVLDKQKDSHDKYEKKEGDYLTSFKKEINKLKEQINNLKIDNEDLQKQLVRIRYASYSQGGKDASNDKNNKKKEEIKTGEANSADEIPIDISSLRKWNELISLLSKEFGLTLENDAGSKKSFSGFGKNGITWDWKVFIQDFKGKFDEFKANITSKFSDYKKVHESTMSDVYKFVKAFFNVEEQNNKQFVPPGEENSRWNNFGDFFGDLKDKWSKIKNRIDTSDLKTFFKDFKISGNGETPQYESSKSESSSNEHTEGKPKNVHFESEKKTTNIHFGSDRKFNKAQKDSEESEWMFERAASRAELQDPEEEDDVNWFLKKNKHLSEDESAESKY